MLKKVTGIFICKNQCGENENCTKNSLSQERGSRVIDFLDLLTLLIKYTYHSTL